MNKIIDARFLPAVILVLIMIIVGKPSPQFSFYGLNLVLALLEIVWLILLFSPSIKRIFGVK